MSHVVLIFIVDDLEMIKYSKFVVIIIVIFYYVFNFDIMMFVLIF